MRDTPYEPQEIMKAAGLYCKGMSERDIAAVLGNRDAQQVRQMIELALRDNLMHFEPVLTLSAMDSEMAEFFNNTGLTQALAAALRDTISLIHIKVLLTRSPQGMYAYYNPTSEAGQPAYKEYMVAEAASLVMVAKRAAQELMMQLFDGQPHCIGLNYGASVSGTVRGISPLPSQVTHPITVVSLFGDLGFFLPDAALPLLMPNEAIACNDIVTMLASRIGPLARAESLNVPVFIPREFTTEARRLASIRKFLTSHASYGRIFGDPSSEADARRRGGLIADMDTIVTSFGSADNYTVLNRFLPSWLNKPERDKLIAYSSEGDIVGDLGGHFIPSQRAKDGGGPVLSFLDDINERLIVAKPDDFQAVAERHAKTPHSGAGVVGIAAGGRKARILHALLSLAPCPLSCLCIDTHCALALLHLVDETRYRDLIETDSFRKSHRLETWSDGTKGIMPIEG